MSIPNDVVAVEVSAMPSTVGAVRSALIQVTPTRDLVWSETGQHLSTMCNTFPAMGWVILPAVDQIGFVTPDTHVGVTNWSYLITATWTEEDGSQLTESGVIQPFSNQSVIYLTNGTAGELVEPADYPVGGVAINGIVVNYTDLPTTGLVTGLTYYVRNDDLVYVWTGAWPAQGQGFKIGSPPGRWWTGSGNPTTTSVPLARDFDMYLDTAAGSGQVWQLNAGSWSSLTSIRGPVGANAQWWTGSGAPGTVSGSNDGDMYLDTSGTSNVYHRAGGTWSFVVSIKGSAGTNGTNGTSAQWWSGSGAPGTVAGSIDGDMYLDTAASDVYRKSSGSWSLIANIKGTTGTAGTNGTSSVWRTGSGAPSSGTGSNTDMYLNISTGDIYGPKTSSAWGSAIANITGPAAADATASTKGILQLTGDLGGTAASPTVPGLASKQAVATPTVVKTAAYTAAVGDLIPVDATSGAFTVTLPTAPTDKSRITLKKIDSSANAVTLATGGSDVFNKASGPTTLTMSLQNTSVTLQYASSSAIWYAVVNDTPKSSLDSVYAQLASPALTGTPTAPTASAGTSNTQLATTGFVATSFAPLASPALTGTPTAPTASAGTSNTQLATTGFVAASFAPLASPALTGTPTVPTASAGTNTTQAASTAFVQTAAQQTGGTVTMQPSKTANYTATAGDFVPANANGGAFTITLPTAPANGTRVCVMKTDTSTNAVTISAGGSDVINASGTTSLVLRPQFAVASLEYNSTSAIWYNQEAATPCKFTWLVQSGTRATGYGDTPEGPYFDQAASIWVRWRTGTADASGSNTIALYSNTSNSATGSAVSGGSTTLTATSAGAVGSWIGPFAVAAGTYLQTNVTAVGTTPGARLYMDCIGVYL